MFRPLSAKAFKTIHDSTVTKNVVESLQQQIMVCDIGLTNTTVCDIVTQQLLFIHSSFIRPILLGTSHSRSYTIEALHMHAACKDWYEARCSVPGH